MEKIAITAFIDNEEHFADEANQMTMSGKDLDKRFTFVLFAHPKIFNKIKKRQNVIIYKYLPPEDNYYTQYKYAKSLEFIKSNQNILNEYVHLIKTDTDVFFTKNLNNYIFDDKISFGEGGYSGTERCVEQLYDLANMFGYDQYKRMFQPGYTLIGPSKDIISLVSLATDLCKDVFYYLCPTGDYTSEGIWGISLYAGTATMIASEIIMCSVFDKEKLNLIPGVVDANCYSNQSLDGIYHIHQWHGDGIYSKFEARSGIYDNAKPLGNGSVSDYCLNIFLKNKGESYV